MKTQITHVSVHQTSKIVALMYFCFSLLLVPVGAVILAFSAHNPGFPQQRVMGFFFLCAPIFYGAFSYVFVALGSVLYNVLAKWVGGIEVEVE